MGEDGPAGVTWTTVQVAARRLPRSITRRRGKTKAGLLLRGKMQRIPMDGFEEFEDLITGLPLPPWK